MRCGALMRGFGMCGGMSVLRAWRPRRVLAEAGPLSNTPREERADPTLTLPREARKHVISRTDYGFIDSQCGRTDSPFYRGSQCTYLPPISARACTAERTADQAKGTRVVSPDRDDPRLTHDCARGCWQGLHSACNLIFSLTLRLVSSKSMHVQVT